MAQWMGQFTGRTHESKVKELERTLEKAIEALKEASSDNFNAKRKSVLKVSARLLAARHKAIKARISKISETRSLENDSSKTRNLIQREKEINTNGVEMILKEYEIQDLVNQG